MMFTFSSISIISWAFPLVLGIARSLNFTTGVENILAFYFLMLASTYTQDGQEVTVENLPWNAKLREGTERKFGFNVRNPSGAVPDEFFLNGQRCGADTDPDRPQEPEEPDTPAEPTTGWSLDVEQSFLRFVTTKNTNTVESHRFGELAGDVSEDGVASLTISLDSVQTGTDIRNQRLRQMLFNTAQYPTASVSIGLGENLSEVLGLSAGEVLSLALPAAVSVNGQTREIDSQLRIERLGNERFLVSSARPLIITADQFDLQGGVEALRNVAGLSSISIAVPVDFALFFETDKLPTP